MLPLSIACFAADLLRRGDCFSKSAAAVAAAAAETSLLTGQGIASADYVVQQQVKWERKIESQLDMVWLNTAATLSEGLHTE